jgi:hypothetical protein
MATLSMIVVGLAPTKHPVEFESSRIGAIAQNFDQGASVGSNKRRNPHLSNQVKHGRY